jgi:Flp pilus assembly pilin Flp
MTAFWAQFRSGDRGQDPIEYTLMLAFVALASAALFASAGGSLNTIWSNTDSQLGTAAGS